MEKFKKLSKAEMKNVLGGQDPIGGDGGGPGCQTNCSAQLPCTSGTCTQVGCGGQNVYFMCI